MKTAHLHTLYEMAKAGYCLRLNENRLPETWEVGVLELRGANGRVYYDVCRDGYDTPEQAIDEAAIMLQHDKTRDDDL